jgi:hypothetical protein
MKWLWNRTQEEPNYVAAIFNVLLIQAIAYGFNISSAQLANWNMLVVLVLAFLTRQTVVPVSIANSQIKTAINASSETTVEEIIAINKENNQ